MSNEEQPVTPNPIRVMIVALPITAWGLTRMLDTSPVPLTCAGVVSSAAEGILRLDEIRPDVILFDLDGEEGTESLAHMHSQSTSRLLALTSSTQKPLHDSAILVGARGIVDKREQPDVMLKAIVKVHAGEMWIDRTSTGRIFFELARQKAAAPADPNRRKIDMLTPRERQMVVALAMDASSPGKQIAARLNISENTLRNHLTSIYGKLGVSNRVELYAFAHRHGLTGEA